MKIKYNCYLIDKEKKWPWREWPLILYDEEKKPDKFDVNKLETLSPFTLKIPSSKKEYIRYDFTFEEAKEIEKYYKKQNPEFDVKINKVYRNRF